MYQPIPAAEAEDMDPFLLLHHHGPHEFQPYNQGLPFGPHPHRGFETLTLIYEGSIEHADSQGFKSVINPGGVQWMTAGRGIVHSENIPAGMREYGGKMEIIQLWMNLPAKLKMTSPHYQGIQNSEIKKVLSNDKFVETAVVSGEFRNSKGAAHSITGLTILNSKAEKNGTEVYEIPESKNVLFYVLNGELTVNGKTAIDHQTVVFDQHSAGLIEIKANTNSRFVLALGEILNEAVVAQGPFVMNSTTEILQAMRDYQMGKMGIMH